MGDIYRARHRLKIGTVIAEPGTDVTLDAIRWRPLRAWVQMGWVKLTQTETEMVYPFRQIIPNTPDEIDWRIKPYYKHNPQNMDPQRYRAEGGGGGTDPAITSISPNPTTVPWTGGRIFTLTGRNLTDAWQVEFDGPAWTANVVSDTTVTVTVADNESSWVAGGSVSVTVLWLDDQGMDHATNALTLDFV
jgi:hypothetical protein